MLWIKNFDIQLYFSDGQVDVPIALFLLVLSYQRFVIEIPNFLT